MKGRSSDFGFLAAAPLPGFPVIYGTLLHTYSGGTVRDLHPFPYYPAENFHRHLPNNTIVL